MPVSEASNVIRAIDHGCAHFTKHGQIIGRINEPVLITIYNRELIKIK
nr:hypothetical protein [uncultured Methanobacterium sp.]